VRKHLLLLSVIVMAVVVADCYGNESVYLALLSAIFLGWAYKNGDNAPFFPILLGAAFLINSFTYPWDAVHILMLGIMWQGIFALFALHSVPESADMEKSALMAWASASMLSVLALYLSPAMISIIPNPVVLAAIGLMAGLAMAYLAWK